MQALQADELKSERIGGVGVVEDDQVLQAGKGAAGEAGRRLGGTKKQLVDNARAENANAMAGESVVLSVRAAHEGASLLQMRRRWSPSGVAFAVAEVGEDGELTGEAVAKGEMGHTRGRLKLDRCNCNTSAVALGPGDAPHWYLCHRHRCPLASRAVMQFLSQSLSACFAARKTEPWEGRGVHASLPARQW